MRKPARDPLEIGENPVAPLGVQLIEGVLEELAVIHRQTWDAGPAGAASFGNLALFRAFPALLSRRKLLSNRDAALPAAQGKS
jgi:hypothetical protein